MAPSEHSCEDLSKSLQPLGSELDQCCQVTKNSLGHSGVRYSIGGSSNQLMTRVWILLDDLTRWAKFGCFRKKRVHLPYTFTPKKQHSGWWFLATPLKNMISSIGMMTFPIYGKIKNGNQTTNQKLISKLQQNSQGEGAREVDPADLRLRLSIGPILRTAQNCGPVLTRRSPPSADHWNYGEP